MKTIGTRLATLGVATLALAPFGAFTVAAHANDSDYRVLRTGGCSGNAVWKLKAKEEDGRIEVEFEVDSNRNGQTWNVTLKRDGNAFFSGTRTTQAPSGSFEVERRIANRAGDDVITGRAVHQGSGQVCSGRVVYAR